MNIKLSLDNILDTQSRKNLRHDTRANTDMRGRRSIRLRDYDYSLPGMYFVTICTHNRQCILGEIDRGHVKLNEYAKIVENIFQQNYYQLKNIVKNVLIIQV